MSKILIITASVNPKEKSVTLNLLDRFLKYYKAKNPNDEFETLDLNTTVFGTKTLTVENFQEYWDQETLDHIKHLKEIDKVIIASPMYNFYIPATVKNYIDHISLANETFSYKYSKKGDAIGLLTNLTVQILAAQGAPLGWYPWGDHVGYLKGVWGFMGAKTTEPILIHGVKTEPYNKMEISQVIDEFDDKIKSTAEAL